MNSAVDDVVGASCAVFAAAQWNCLSLDMGVLLVTHRSCNAKLDCCLLECLYFVPHVSSPGPRLPNLTLVIFICEDIPMAAKDLTYTLLSAGANYGKSNTRQQTEKRRRLK